MYNPTRYTNLVNLLLVGMILEALWPFFMLVEVENNKFSGLQIAQSRYTNLYNLNNFDSVFLDGSQMIDSLLQW